MERSLKNIPLQLRAAATNPQVWGFVVSLAVCALLALAFFYPDAQLGNTLRQHDMLQGAANNHEIEQWMQAHPDADTPRWTNALFSGMPTFQIAPSYPSNSLFAWLDTLMGAGLPVPCNLLFMMMAGMLILLAAMRARWYLGLIGAVAWAFSTYFIIIIGAGHIWKFVTLAFVPPTLAGMVMAYRGQRILGAALAALFAMMQVMNNHVQMSYYFLMVVAGLIIVALWQALKEGKMAGWWKASGWLVLAAILAVGANLPNLYHTYRYSKASMRGAHSELTSTANDQANATSGLDRDYITQYSYGRAETFSLLIPNIKGGASARPHQGQMVPTSVADFPGAEEAMSQLNEGERQYVSGYASQYFGDPEGTNGPVYVGAVIFALFLLGCIIVRGPAKWVLIALTLLSVLLAMGRNCQWLTDLFINYVPMYSSFRAPESILVVAEFTIPLLAVMALQRALLGTPNRRELVRPVLAAFGICAFFCLLGWLWPGIYGSAISDNDLYISDMIGRQLQAQGYPQQALAMYSVNNPAIAGAIEKLRYGALSADALRSLIFIILGAGALLLTAQERLKPWMGATMIGLLVAADLYTVNKRYLSHDSFCTPELTASDPFPLDSNDRAILADTASHYRVLDMPRFFQAAPSYHHKAIGGYHAAKLTRYQDLIDRHLAATQRGAFTPAALRVLDMLNAKYIIGPDGRLVVNPTTLGPAWLVDTIVYVDTPDAEMAALDTLQTGRVAVADRKFAPMLGAAVPPREPSDTIYLTSYAPDRLTYHVQTARGALAVLSEVYFPWGWEARVDGKPTQIGRVDYLLRAVALPAGARSLVLSFRPRSVAVTVGIARACVIIIYIMLALGLALALARPPKKKEELPR